MNKNKIHNLASDAQKHTVSAPDSAWLKIENKLVKNTSTIKVSWYKKLSYAAVLTALVSMTMLIGNQEDYFNNHNKSLDTYQQHITDLMKDNDVSIYDVSKLENLKIAYTKLDVKYKF